MARGVMTITMSALADNIKLLLDMNTPFGA